MIIFYKLYITIYNNYVYIMYNIQKAFFTELFKLYFWKAFGEKILLSSESLILTTKVFQMLF